MNMNKLTAHLPVVNLEPGMQVVVAVPQDVPVGKAFTGGAALPTAELIESPGTDDWTLVVATVADAYELEDLPMHYLRLAYTTVGHDYQEERHTAAFTVHDASQAIVIAGSAQ